MPSGFRNAVLAADNVDFTGETITTGQVTLDGQLLIGSSTSPNIRVGKLQSVGGTVLITTGHGQINLEAGSAVPTTFHTDAGDAVPLVSILNLYGQATPSTSGIRVTGAGNTASITMYSPFKGGFHFTQSTAGTPEVLQVSHSDATNTGSHAELFVLTPAGGGDAYASFTITPTFDWNLGISHTDASFKICHGGPPSAPAEAYINITTTGDITCGTGTPTVAGGSDKILVSDCWNLVGATLASEIFNTDNTNAGSRANLNIRVGGSSAGDAVVSYLVNGANSWSVGLDNSDSDNFKISSGTSLGVNDRVTITTSESATLYLKSILQYYSNVGDVTELEVNNPDTTNANSSTRINQRTEVGGGDTEISFDTSGAGTFMMGSRRTDSCFVLTSGFNPATKLISGTDRFKVTTGGAITFNNAYTFPTADGTSGQVLTTNGAGVVSWEGSGGGTWAVTTVDATAVVNKSYIANKAGLLTMTLPATAAIGDTIRITGINTAVGWRIAQNANQRIHVGLNSSTAGVGGYIEATAIRDSVELVCVVAGASSEYNCVSMMGNITVA